MTRLSARAGRAIWSGQAAGVALVSAAPISFYGGIDLETGVVTEQGHPLEGVAIGGSILVFPRGKGSTVGSYALLRLRKGGIAPAALVMEACDTTVAVGAIIAEIPCVDQVEIAAIRSGDSVAVDGAGVTVVAHG